MDSDRRQYSRCEPAKLVYAQFGRANGGLVLNASLSGLRFQTVVPTEPNTVVKLTISLSSKESIEVSGKIIWTDQAGKMGGLEFVDPSPEVQARLENWLLPLMPPEKADSQLPQQPFLVDTQRPAKSFSGTLTQAPAPAAVPIFELPPKYKTKSGIPRMFGSLTEAALPENSAPVGAPTFELPSKDKAKSGVPRVFNSLTEVRENAARVVSRRPKNRFLSGLANLIIFCLLLLLPAIYIYNFHPLLAYSVIDRVRELYGGKDVPQQAEPPQTSTVQNNEPPPAAPPELAKDRAATSGVAPSAGLQPEQAAPSVPAAIPAPKVEKPAPSPRIKQSSTPKPEDYRNASPAKLPVDPNDPNELWLAVGQGDTDSEVTLARLYLTGRLVKKNCEQGRVLLTAASKKGNAEAISELHELLRTGCK
jgi:hypothetical protein